MYIKVRIISRDFSIGKIILTLYYLKYCNIRIKSQNECQDLKQVKDRYFQKALQITILYLKTFAYTFSCFS